MLWVTTQSPSVDRLACSWIIARFVDPAAEFLYVPAHQVRSVARCAGGKSFGVTGSDYVGKAGHTTIEVLLNDFTVDDPGALYVAEVVTSIDRPAAPPESGGLLAVAELARQVKPEEDVGTLAFRLYDAMRAHHLRTGRSLMRAQPSPPLPDRQSQ